MTYKPLRKRSKMAARWAVLLSESLVGINAPPHPAYAPREEQPSRLTDGVRTLSPTRFEVPVQRTTTPATYHPLVTAGTPAVVRGPSQCCETFSLCFEGV
jgi:hypothetical protein